MARLGPVFARTDGTAISVGPVVFQSRGVLIVNRSSVDAFATDDAGNRYDCPAHVAATWPLDIPTSRMSVQTVQAAAAADEGSLSVTITDAETILSTAQLLTISLTGSPVKVLHNDVVVASEPALDFQDNADAVFTVADDAANSRILIGLASRELAYNESNVTTLINVFSNAALSVPLVTLPTLNFDGATPVILEFFAPWVNSPTLAGARLRFWLFDGTGLVCLLGLIETPAGSALQIPANVSRRFAPAAGPHTYSVRADFDTVNSNWSVGAGNPFGVSENIAMYARLRRV